jgi:hypothetical protein
MAKYQGLLQGWQMAQAYKESQQDRALQQARLDLAEEQFGLDRLKTMQSFLSTYSSGRSSRRSSENSVETSAEKQSLLKAIKTQLPEGSELVTKLANADTKTLDQAFKIITDGRDRATSLGLNWSPEQSESLFEEVYVTTVQEKKPFSAQELAELAGVDLEGDSPIPGVPWLDYLETSLEPETYTSVTITPAAKPMESLTPTEVTQYRTLYKNQLLGALTTEKDILNQAATSGQEVDQNKVDKVVDALEALENDNLLPAQKLIGAETAITLAESDRRIAPKMNLIVGNAALSFTMDEYGEELLARAIRVGILKEGDTIILGGQILPLTQATIDTALGG